MRALAKAGLCQRPAGMCENSSSHTTALDWQIKIIIIIKPPTINKQKEHMEPWETH